MKKQNKEYRKREDFYPFVLLVTGLILGWGAVVSRDLEGTVALVKWVLLALFLEVTCVQFPYSVACLLWDRRKKSQATPYFIRTKPRRLTEGFRLPVKKKERRAPARFLFPEGKMRSDLSDEFVMAWEATLGKVLKADGLPYYTDDPAVIRYRAELFRELYGTPALADTLNRFAGAYPSGTSRGSFRETLTVIRMRHEAVIKLGKDLEALAPRSEALKKLKQLLKENEEARKRAEEEFARLPEDLFRVRSLTLAVNLDSAGYAHEAGIVALHGEAFDGGEAVPLVRTSAAKQSREQSDPASELNRELMNCVDRVLEGEFRRLRVDLDDLRAAELGDALADDLRFAAEFVEYIKGLEGCEVRFDALTSGNSGAPEEQRGRNSGIAAQASTDDGGISAPALKPFGCRVLRKPWSSGTAFSTPG